MARRAAKEVVRVVVDVQRGKGETGVGEMDGQVVLLPGPRGCDAVGGGI